MATLLGEWGFLDNLNDTSGNGRTATVPNGSVTYVTGPQTSTRAVQFPGTNCEVRYGRTGLEPASLGVTSMGWVKFTSGAPAGAYVIPFAKALSAGSTRFGTLVYDGHFAPRARWTDDLHYSDAGPLVTDGAWHHLAIVDGDSRWAFLLDGTNLGSGARSVTGSGHFENYSWGSGWVEGNLGNSYAGMCVSGVRIFQGVLSDAEVVTWKNTAITAGGGGLPTQPWTSVYVGSTLAQTVYVGSTKVWGT